MQPRVTSRYTCTCLYTARARACQINAYIYEFMSTYQAPARAPSGRRNLVLFGG